MLATQTDECVGTIIMEDYATGVDFRSDKVRLSRWRLAKGRYDREELLDSVLDAILADITL